MIPIGKRPQKRTGSDLATLFRSTDSVSLKEGGNNEITLDEACDHPAGQSSGGSHAPAGRLWRSTTTTTASGKQTSVTSGGGGGAGTTVALTPKYGGTLRIAAQSAGANIGWPATMIASGVYVETYYETLLHTDNKGKVSPWLAESYKVADDHKSITFTIRKGVKFTDGSDLTADVVKWNLEQYAKSQPWTSIDVVDPNTVRVNFKAWDSSLPASFGDNNPALYMVSEAAYNKNGQDGWSRIRWARELSLLPATHEFEFEGREKPELLG